MKPSLILCSLLLAATPAFADTIDLGTHGTLTLTVPAGWSLTFAKQPDIGVTLQLAPKGEVNAQGVMSIVFVEKGAKSSDKDIDEKTLAAADNFIEQSVEKKKVLKHFTMSGGAYGSYCYFTDASLVGSQPQKGNFKGVASGVMRLSDDVSAAVTLLTDDQDSPEFAEMLEIVSSAKVTAR